ncbi:MAG: error-prone DNA polymerase [Neomegalonema sp.]|nr:error-prone DNA polymerase [Neomegalonema sp.]
MSFADLAVTSNFTFLTGASHPEEMVERAAALGLAAIAITDRNSLAGVVRAYARLKQLKKEAIPARKTVSVADVRARAKTLRARKDPSSRAEMPDPPEPHPDADFQPLSIPKLIVGARLVLSDAQTDWVALPTDRAAYGRLTRLLSIGKLRAQKGDCHLTQSDLYEWGSGMILLALPHQPLSPPVEEIAAMARHFPQHVHTAAAPLYDGQDQKRLQQLAECAMAAHAPLVAVSNALMHHARRRRLADVLTCLREGLKIDSIGTRALPNAERRLRSPQEMARLFQAHPGAVRRSLEIAERCQFDLSQLRYEYPDEVTQGEAPQLRLTRLTEEGLRWRYPSGAPPKITAAIAKELRLIERLDYARYFLTVHDVVRFARDQQILCQGRGSAANSVVCYVLGITDANPELISAVFERFISEARGEPPDIDVDFEHERREEVIQYIYERYGRHRAGLCATVIHFRARAALREVGKVMGLSQDMVCALASQVWGWSSKGIPDQHIRELGLDPTDRRLRQTLDLVHELIGFPRHLSQHVGGFIITRDRLDAYVPIENAAMENRTVIEWDKDDIDALGMMKVDVLSLGMLTCIRKALDLLAAHGGPRLTLASIPEEDPAVYDMLCKGDSLGVFQVESRAQMNFLPRMKPRKFYDLVIEVAIVRPGPIQGDMVHPYLRRRNGEEAVEYAHPELDEILGKTLGVPLFQEQAMQIAMVAAQFTPDEADGLRRAMATFRKTGTIQSYRDLFIERMTARGYAADFTERVFNQIEGFGEYGFPESHAASFAALVYASSWLKCYHPAIFACALLNSQPMGFYAPAQIVRDVREHGVEIRPVCINASDWDCTLEPAATGLALRLGFRQVKGIDAQTGQTLSDERRNGYPSLESVWQRGAASAPILTRLAEADAFAGLGYTRRAAIWAAQALQAPRQMPLFQHVDDEGIVEPPIALPAASMGEEVIEDYVATRLSLRAHPLALLRARVRGNTAQQQASAMDGTRMTITGLVITRQRPGTASGVIFVTLEDETGVANVVVWPKVYERFRRAVIAGRLLRVQGKLQREGIVTHLIAWRIEDLSEQLDCLDAAPPNFAPPNLAIQNPGTIPGTIDVSTPRADETKRPLPPSRTRARHPREQAKILFPSRDFH